MMYPVGGDIDEVNVIALAHLLISFGATAIACGPRPTELFQQLLAGLHTVGLHIAESFYGGSFYLGETLHRAWTAHTQTDETNSHRIYWRGGQLQHIVLSGRPLWHLCFDHFRLLSFIAACHQQQSYCQKVKESFHIVVLRVKIVGTKIRKINYWHIN